jgi:nitrate/nitrite transport system permease protein
MRLRAAALTLVVLALLILVWHAATRPPAAQAAATGAGQEQAEYLRMMGKEPGAQKSTGFPTPAQVGETFVQQLSAPLHDNGPNDKGIAIQLAHSLGRVALGFLLACMVAVPLGYAMGTSLLLRQAFDPFVQILKPISPLAWMPLALYTIKDSGASGVFVIFICSVWPILLNTAFGVLSVKREWINVARTLELPRLRTAMRVILPAAAPTVLTGMRIGMGIAWLVIVAAEMLVGGTGIGYFVWNEWNNLALANVIFAILLIGVVGMALDLAFGRLQRMVTYVE